MVWCVQFVRKLSGFTRPSKADEVVFARAVDQVAHAVQELLDSLATKAPFRDRDVEASKARARTAGRVLSSDARRPERGSPEIQGSMKRARQRSLGSEQASRLPKMR